MKMFVADIKEFISDKFCHPTLMGLIFARTNFRRNLFFLKNCISRVLIFADSSFENFSRVLIFANRQKLSIFLIFQNRKIKNKRTFSQQ